MYSSLFMTSSHFRIRLRGVILYELQATLACYARRKFSAGEISTDHMKNVMKVKKQDEIYFRLRL